MPPAPRYFDFSQAMLFSLPSPSARFALHSRKGMAIRPLRTAKVARLQLEQTSRRESQTADPSDVLCGKEVDGFLKQQGKKAQSTSYPSH